MKQLLSEAKALEKLGQSDKLLFLNCWFLSMPQLLLLLDGVTNADELVKRLDRLKYMTFRSLDFYRDFAHARRGKLI